MPDFLEPSTEAPVGFPFAEKMAREKAGLSEDDFRALRGKHLRKDADFVYHKKAIYLTAGALKKIAPALLCREPGNEPPGGIAAQESALTPTVAKLLIVRTDLANTRLLLCCPENDNPDRPKNPVRVRVRSQEGFRIRTAIEARLVQGYTDLYDFAGKYPRKKNPLPS